MHLMYFNETSYLKSSIANATTLSPEQKRGIPVGAVLVIDSFRSANGHYQVTLVPEQARRLQTARLEWFVWQPAVKIVGMVGQKR